MEDFIESLRTDSVTQLPRDGTVHELTSNVLMFLEQLLEYTETLGRVLADNPGYSIQLEKLRIGDKNKALLGLYISKRYHIYSLFNLIVQCSLFNLMQLHFI